MGTGAELNGLTLELFKRIVNNQGHVLCANLLVEDENGIFRDPSEPQFPLPWSEFVERSVVMEVSAPGVPRARIGFVGVTENDLQIGKLKTPGKGESLELLRKAVQDVLAQNVHIVVLVGHMGTLAQGEDEKLRIGDVILKQGAQKFDLAFDGNSHHGFGGRAWAIQNGFNAPSWAKVWSGDFPQDVLFSEDAFGDHAFGGAEKNWGAFYVQAYKYGGHYGTARITIDTARTAKELYDDPALTIDDQPGPNGIFKPTNITSFTGELVSIEDVFPAADILDAIRLPTVCDD